ncbi:MAG: hypothetical protein HFG90_05065 [Acholeplasmatales bacterium]|nr:hypothetical protein [Acholeplasmatales bacterium]
MSQAIRDYGFTYFSISMINKKFLENNDILMNVKEFKEFVKTQPYKVALTGGAGYWKHCKIWNIENIKLNLPKKYLRPKKYEIY